MQIEKEIDLRAARSRVWQALTDSRQFGEWFRVKLEGPFAPGQVIHGQTTYPGYEHVRFRAEVVEMRPEEYFAYRWHPFAIEAGVDYSHETPTLVEFFLEETAEGTHLRVTESGFEHVPAERRLEAFRSNTGGWEEQLRNIAAYVAR